MPKSCRRDAPDSPRILERTLPHARKLPTLLLGIVLAVAAQAADWPLFQGNPTRNAIAANPLPPPLEVEWTYDAPDGIEDLPGLGAA